MPTSEIKHAAADQGSPFTQLPNEKVRTALLMSLHIMLMESLKTALDTDPATRNQNFQKFLQFLERLKSEKLHGKLIGLIGTHNYPITRSGVCAGTTERVIEFNQSDALTRNSFDIVLNRFKALDDLLDEDHLFGFELEEGTEFSDIETLVEQIKVKLANADKKEDKAPAVKRQSFAEYVQKKIDKMQAQLDTYLKDSLTPDEQQQHQDFFLDIQSYMQSIALYQSQRLFNSLFPAAPKTEEDKKDQEAEERFDKIEDVSHMAQSKSLEELTTQQICELVTDQLLPTANFAELKDQLTPQYEVDANSETVERIKLRLEKINVSLGEINSRKKLIEYLKQIRALLREFDSTDFSMKIDLLGNKIKINHRPDYPKKEKTNWQYISHDRAKQISEEHVDANFTELKYANLQSGLIVADCHLEVVTMPLLTQCLVRFSQFAQEAKAKNISISIDGIQHQIAILYEGINLPTKTEPTLRFFDIQKNQLLGKSLKISEADQITKQLFSSLPSDVQDHPDERVLRLTYFTNPDNLENLSQVMAKFRKTGEFKQAISIDSEKLFFSHDWETKELRHHSREALLISTAKLDLDSLDNFIMFRMGKAGFEITKPVILRFLKKEIERENVDFMSYLLTPERGMLLQKDSKDLFSSYERLELFRDIIKEIIPPKNMTEERMASILIQKSLSLLTDPMDKPGLIGSGVHLLLTSDSPSNCRCLALMITEMSKQPDYSTLLQDAFTTLLRSTQNAKVVSALLNVLAEGLPLLPAEQSQSILQMAAQLAQRNRQFPEREAMVAEIVKKYNTPVVVAEPAASASYGVNRYPLFSGKGKPVAQPAVAPRAATPSSPRPKKAGSDDTAQS